MKNKTNYASPKLILLSIMFLFTLSCSKKESDGNALSYPTPSIATINPKIGIATAEVTITGEKFGSDASVVQVYFGNRLGTIISVTDQMIKVKAPSGFVSATVDVRVVLGSSSSNKIGFNYTNNNIPLIQTISPTFFTNSTVVLKGKDFSPIIENNIVKFGDVTATVLYASATMLKVKTPDLGNTENSQVTVITTGKKSLPVPISIDKDQTKIANFAWTSTTTRPGVIYKKGEMTLFGGSIRSMYVLDITLDATNTLGIGAANPYLATVTMANNYNAVVAVNAGYFKLAGTYDKDPYIRINGTTIQSGDLDVTPVFTNSALLINNNVATIRKFDGNSKFMNQTAALIPVSEASNVLVCGPMLITSDVLEDVDLTISHNTSITSRTGLGVSADGKHVFIVVVDSGLGGSYAGVSTPQLAKILQALGAVDGMNLDGGGSSTMFVKNEGDMGRVNFPYGGTYQRPVRSIIYVK